MKTKPGPKDPSERKVEVEATHTTLRVGRDELSIKDYLYVDDRSIWTELERHASKYYFIASVTADVRYARDELKDQLTLLAGRLRERIVERSASLGERKPNDTLIEAMINRDEEHQELSNRILKETRTLDRLYALRDALAQRKDLLVQIATDVRRERDINLERRSYSLDTRERKR